MTNLDKAFDNFLEKISNNYLDVVTHCGNPKYGVSYRIIDHSNRFQIKISRPHRGEQFLVTANAAFLTQEQRIKLYYAAEKRVKSDEKKYEEDTRMIKLKEDFQMMYEDVL